MTGEHQLGDAPIDERYREMMADLAQAIDFVFNGEAKGKDRQTGFVLLTVPFGDDTADAGRCNFISNGIDRQDIVALFKEMIARFEGQAKPKAGRA